MNSLFAQASEVSSERRGIGESDVEIATLQIRFPRASKSHSPPGLAKTYTSKPLVEVDGEALYGELAILRYLEKDGWNGVWVDTFHSRGKRKVVWSGMPPDGKGELSKDATLLFNQIVDKNDGKSSGFFDVFAWKNGNFVFIEYKGKGDSSNKNESRWIRAAIAAGIDPQQLYFVVY